MLSLTGGTLKIPKATVKVMPTVVKTNDDWIADVVETRPGGRRNRYRVGVSPNLTEQQARAVIEDVIRRRGAAMADVTMWRRRDGKDRLPTAEELTRSVQGGRQWK
jgi:hypothetical protein